MIALFEAAIVFAQSVLYHLEKECAGWRTGKPWFKTTIDRWRTDFWEAQLFRFFDGERHVIVHQGPGGFVRVSLVGEMRWRRYVASPSEAPEWEFVERERGPQKVQIDLLPDSMPQEWSGMSGFDLLSHYLSQLTDIIEQAEYQRSRAVGGHPP